MPLPNAGKSKEPSSGASRHLLPQAGEGLDRFSGDVALRWNNPNSAIPTAPPTIAESALLNAGQSWSRPYHWKKSIPWQLLTRSMTLPDADWKSVVQRNMEAVSLDLDWSRIN